MHKFGPHIGSLLLHDPTADEMLCLFEAMASSDDSIFVCNTSTLFDDWRDGRFRTIKAAESLAMYNQTISTNMFLQRGHPWILPAFISVGTSGRVDFLWVHPKIRRRGVGTALVKLSAFKKPLNRHVLPSAIAFWQRIKE